jgi:phosphomannomutase
VNFRVKDAGAAIAAVRAVYAGGAEVDEMDGLSLSLAGWRLNLRRSNTEPLLRLNVEARSGTVEVVAMAEAIGAVIGGSQN